MISIITPVYNTERYLRRALDSVLAQTYGDFEHILIDDSTDSSSAICDEYAARDGRFIVIHNKTNKGIARARKTGAERSRGDYVLFMDSDDWWEPDMLEALYKRALEGGYDAVACDFYNDRDGAYDYQIQTLDTDDPHDNLGFKHCCALWNKLIKRETLLKIEFPEAGHYDDMVITQQVYFYAKKISKINRPYYHYFFNPLSNTYRPDAEHVLRMHAGIQENIAFIIRFYERNLTDRMNYLRPAIRVRVANFCENALRAGILFRVRLAPELRRYGAGKIRTVLRLALTDFLRAVLPYGLIRLNRRLRTR